MKQILIVFTMLSILSSCISSSSIVNGHLSEIKGSEIDGKYNNIDTTLKGISLWNALHYCKSFKRDTIKNSDNSTVSLKLKNDRRLMVIRWENNVAIDTIVLKVKRDGNFISVNRNLYLVPIPFVFYRYHEAKIVLATSDNGNLFLGYRRRQFIWTILAGSVNQKSIQIHKKLTSQ